MKLHASGCIQQGNNVVSLDTAARQDFNLRAIRILQLCQQINPCNDICLLAGSQNTLHTKIDQRLCRLEGIRCFIKCLVEDSFLAIAMDQRHHLCRRFFINCMIRIQKAKHNAIGTGIKKQLGITEHCILFIFVVDKASCSWPHHTDDALF